MGVSAAAGVEDINIIKIPSMQAAVLLYILELDVVANVEFTQPGRVDLQDIPGWLAWGVCRPPGTGQYGIHDILFGVDPYYCQIHENEQHMNGGIQPAITPFNEQEAFVRW